MTRQAPTKPLIAVIGATGTGKSQLAVSIAKRFNGEVINGDAMQLYSGLPIITNKIASEEQQGIPHHLLGCIGLEEQTWVVGTFVSKALETIEDIHKRGKLPILVGGTHYYTQSLLFEDQLAEADDGSLKSKAFVEDTSARWPILREPTEKILEELEKVDPVMANRWHPNDRRKIQRSLEIYLQTGRKASDIYAEQNKEHDLATSTATGDGPSSRSRLRFPTLLFWLHSSSEVLQERLEKRVDKMVDAGLLDEVKTLDTFAESRARAGDTLAESRGIWVSIGYKEFKQYSAALRTTGATEKDLAKLKSEAVELTKIANRQYAKRQLKWIRIKLAGALAKALAQQSLFVLDSSDVAAFEPNVETPALDVTQSFLHGLPLPQPSSLSKIAADALAASSASGLTTSQQPMLKHHCDVCGVTCVTNNQWQMHIKSKAHRKLTSRRNAQKEEAKISAGNG